MAGSIDLANAIVSLEKFPPETYFDQTPTDLAEKGH